METLSPKSCWIRVQQRRNTLLLLPLPFSSSPLSSPSSWSTLCFRFYIFSFSLPPCPAQRPDTHVICTYISLPLLLQIKFHYLPESLAIVFLGAVLGLLMTALPEAETKRVCLNESTLANGFWSFMLNMPSRLRPFLQQCSSLSFFPPSSLSLATILTRATFFRCLLLAV